MNVRSNYCSTGKLTELRNGVQTASEHRKKGKQERRVLMYRQGPKLPTSREALLRALALMPHWGRRRRDSLCNANREVLRISRFGVSNHDDWEKFPIPHRKRRNR
jgi:hypothetical protein